MLRSAMLSSTQAARAVVLGLVMATGAAGCGVSGAGETGGRLSTVAAFYPLAFVAERVGGRQVDVANLTPAGGEPHDLELGPQQVAEVAEADLVVYERGFQPSVDEAVAQNDPRATLEVTEVAKPLGEDPHLWLDPVRLARVATAVGETMARLDPDRAAAYRSRAEALVRDLHGLDRAFARGLQDCRDRTVVTTHEAFGYLTRRYGLEQVAVSGLTPESEPSPGRLADVARLVESQNVATVYFESPVSAPIARTLASDTGARSAVLDPLETLRHPGRDDYLTVMRDNLAALREGLRCS